MRVFIGCYGVRGQRVAADLSNWLKTIYAPFELEVFVPPDGVPGGAVWLDWITQGTCSHSSITILCVTQEAHRSVWLPFEAGLARGQPGKLIPAFLGTSVATEPYLSPIQGVFLGNGAVNGYVQLVKTLNSHLGQGNSSFGVSAVSRAERSWKRLNRDIANTLAEPEDGYRGLWGHLVDSNLSEFIDIVYSEDDSQTGSAFTYENELRAMVEILQVAPIRGGAVRLRSLRGRKDASAGNCRILIGGPKRNEIAKRELDQLRTYIQLPHEVGAAKSLVFGGSSYTPVYGSLRDRQRPGLGRVIEVDYGVVIGIRRHSDSILIVAGYHSCGTHGATMGVTDPKLTADLYSAISKIVSLPLQPQTGYCALLKTTADPLGAAQRAELVGNPLKITL